MDLKKQQWYVGWFFTCLAVIDEFMDEREVRVWRHRHGANLCTFMRVSLIWGPFIIALHIIVYGGAIASITYLPVHLFGFGGYAWIIGAIAGLVGTIWLLKIANRAWNAMQQRQRDARRGKAFAEMSTVVEPSAEPVDKGSSFASIVWSYAVAVKQRVCPIINFN